MAREVHTGEVLDGHVELDGAYFGGHIRPANMKSKRVDRRLKRHQTGTRRVVVAMREREGRTLPFIAMSEGEGVALAVENVSRTATISSTRTTGSSWMWMPRGRSGRPRWVPCAR